MSAHLFLPGDIREGAQVFQIPGASGSGFDPRDYCARRIRLCGEGGLFLADFFETKNLARLELTAETIP